MLPDDAVLRSIDRRSFLRTASAATASLAAASAAPWAVAGMPDLSPPAESGVSQLFAQLSPEQRQVICFDWDHVDPKRGLLRTRISNNWQITEPTLNSDFFTDDQRHLVRKIFEGIIDREWHERIDQQLADDSDGYGENNSIAIFGNPGSGPFEFVMTGRHMTLRCDGNSAEHVAFGGPLFYGHAADGFYEGPQHPGNVFWPQAQLANKLYEMLDGKQRDKALLDKMPPESHVGFRGDSPLTGLPVEDLLGDQRDHLQKVLEKLLEPYRQRDREEVVQCLEARGGLAKCHLTFFREEDIGEDGVWDNWRLEGPAFVWHFRGAPHVHVWVNVADSPDVKLNA